MATARTHSIASVVDDDNLLREILAHLDTLKTSCSTALVSKQWLSAVSDPAVLKNIRSRSSPPLLGFITVCVRADWTYVRFIPMPELSASLEAEANLVEHTFPEVEDVMAAQHDEVLFCRDGEMFVRDDTHGGRYALRTIHDRDPIFIVTQPAIPAVEDAVIPVEPTGAFIVIGEEVTFFQHYHQDAPVLFGGNTVVIKIFINGGWETVASAPLGFSYPSVLHSRPYAILVDSVLFMAYETSGFISYDISSGVFIVHPLPNGFEFLYDSDYMIARQGKKGLCIIRMNGLDLEHWVLEDPMGGSEWILRRAFYLPSILGASIPWSFWELVADGDEVLGNNGAYTGIKAAGDNGDWAVLVFGASSYMFFVDLTTEDYKVLPSPVDHELFNSVVPVSKAQPAFPLAL